MPRNPIDEFFAYLQEHFRNATVRYNEVVRLTDSLEESLKKKQDSGAVVTGVKNMLFNRYQSVTTLPGLMTRASDGAEWAYYFRFAQPSLEWDVKKSIVEMLFAGLSPSNLGKAGATGFGTNLKKAAATVFGTTQRDRDRLESTARDSVNFQLKTMGVSLAGSVAVSSLLNRVGTTAHSEFVRQMAMKTRFAWRVSGVLAIMYGFGQISDVMKSTGNFANCLQPKRDAFIDLHKKRIREIVQEFSDACEEADRYG
jgi:hypothetical protein